MGSTDRIIVDRLAADFYERSLRYAQSQAIESRTAQLYANSDPRSREAYLSQRRNQYQQLNRQQQDALRGVKSPQFIHLSEQQKWPFRQHALNQLGAVGAIRTSQSYTGSTHGVRPGI